MLTAVVPQLLQMGGGPSAEVACARRALDDPQIAGVIDEPPRDAETLRSQDADHLSGGQLVRRGRGSAHGDAARAARGLGDHRRRPKNRTRRHRKRAQPVRCRSVSRLVFVSSGPLLTAGPMWFAVLAKRPRFSKQPEASRPAIRSSGRECTRMAVFVNDLWRIFLGAGKIRGRGLAFWEGFPRK